MFPSKELMAQQSSALYFFYKLFNRLFFLFKGICRSLAIFHQLLFENMALKDNQFYQSSYFEYRNYQGKFNKCFSVWKGENASKVFNIVHIRKKQNL